MGGLGIRKVMPGAVAPVLDQSIDYLCDLQMAIVIRAEIPCAGTKKTLVPGIGNY